MVKNMISTKATRIFLNITFINQWLARYLIFNIT
jgi:hypothetical protein